jgi:hypothetical protein
VPLPGGDATVRKRPTSRPSSTRPRSNNTSYAVSSSRACTASPPRAWDGSSTR